MADADLKAKRKAWREANAEKRKAYAKAYHQANKEKANAASAAHYGANPAAYKEKAAKWVLENPERRYEIATKWRDDHPELYAQARRKDWATHKPKRQVASKKYREQKPEFVKSLTDAWKARNPEANAHHVGLRRTRRLQAMPAWASIDAIKAIYKQAKEMTLATGVEHHVDHFYPLKSALVCGLHNEFNLRVIPAAVNQSKGNRLIDG